MSARTSAQDPAQKSRQVARRLDRPVRRRQQFERQRQPSAGNRGMAGLSKQLLHAHCHHRALLVIADRQPRSGRRLVMGRNQPGDLGLRAVTAQRQQALVETVPVDRLERGYPRLKGREPGLQRIQQRRVGNIRPGCAETAIEKADPVAQLQSCGRKRQCPDPGLADARTQGRHGLRGVRPGQRRLGKA